MIIQLMLPCAALASPIADPSTLSSTTVAWCDTMLEDLQATESRVYTSSACRLSVGVQRHTMDLLVTGARGQDSASPLAADDLTELEDEAIAVLQTLGFEADEFVHVRTMQLAVDSTEDATPGVHTTSYLDVKTFVDRAIAGGRMGGERLVVTQRTDGALVRVSGRWTPVDERAAIVDVAPPMTLPEAAMLVSLPEDWVHVDRVFVVDQRDDGTVTAGRVVQEIAMYAPDEKIRTLYLENGIPLLPSDARSVPTEVQ